jgi:hypothetical protein
MEYRMLYTEDFYQLHCADFLLGAISGRLTPLSSSTLKPFLPSNKHFVFNIVTDIFIIETVS